MTRCLLDMDGVLADFTKGVFGLRGEPVPATLAWDFIRPEEWEKFTADFWADLAPTPFAREIVRVAEYSFGEENVCILTSPCNTVGCFDGKLIWLREHFPQFYRGRRFLVGPAKEFCASPTTLLVDDYDGNVDKFRKAGGKAVLVPQPWNTRMGVPLEIALREIAAKGLLLN